MTALLLHPPTPQLLSAAADALACAGPDDAAGAWPAVLAHSVAVTALAGRAAACAGFAARDVAAARACALLHDIGKARVPGELLGKPGRLAADEWALVEAHSAAGAEIVAGVPMLAHLAPAVRAVHERWDGSGYPDGLWRRDIPRTARLVAACDAYVAMTEHRAYGRRATHREALAELRAGAGSQFDPCLVGAVAVAAAAGRPAPRARAIATIAADATVCAAV
ncbi:MAG TPA: HD domain-containing phosphohydrolase [Solirubrobacteraceae bacterium]